MAARKKKKRSVAKKQSKPARSAAVEKEITSSKQLTAGSYLKRLRDVSGATEEVLSMFGSEVASATVDEWVSTGSIAVDRMMGGGWPIGAISECRGWEHVGKSVLVDQSLAYVQSIGGIAALIDTEKSRDKKWTAKLGVNLDELIHFKVQTIEGCFKAIDEIMEVQESVISSLGKKKSKLKPPPLLIVWDALGGTPTQAELEGTADQIHVGVAQRSVKQNFRRIMQRLYKLRAALVVVNHVYIDIKTGRLVSYGGSGVRFSTHVRVELARTGNVTLGGKTVGHTIQVKPRKNRVVGFRDPVETALLYGAGIDNSYTLYEWGKKNNWIENRGAWSWLFPPDEEPISFQSFVGLGKIFAERSDLYQAMANAFMTME